MAPTLYRMKPEAKSSQASDQTRLGRGMLPWAFCADQRCSTRPWTEQQHAVFQPVQQGNRCAREEFIYELKAGPAGGLRPPSGPATTR